MACENYDQDEFTSAVQNFDSISRLDPWKTTLLLKIKNTIQEPDGGITWEGIAWIRRKEKPRIG